MTRFNESQMFIKPRTKHAQKETKTLKRMRDSESNMDAKYT